MDWQQLSEQLKQRTPKLIQTKPPCAVLVLLAGDELVLEVRAKSLRHQPGEVCFPGGRMEGDETAIDCALRETGEELGLTADRIRVLGELDRLIHNRGQIICPVVAVCEPELLEELRPSAAEVERVLLVPLNWLKEHSPEEYIYQQDNSGLDTLPRQMADSLRSYPKQRSGHFWLYEDQCIWGLTAAILRQLLELLN